MQPAAGVAGRTVRLLAVLLATASCTGGSATAVAGDTAAIATEAATRLAIEGIAAPESFEISRFDLSVRHGSSTTSLQADLRATARAATDELQFEYCGPPLVFLSIDGSTVEITIRESILRAQLATPLRAGEPFGLRFLAVVPRGEGPAELSLPEIAAGLLCS